MQLKRLGQSFLKNLDTIIAVLFSAIAAIYGLFGVGQTQASINQAQAVILTAIAISLGLLAVGIIRDREAREKLASEIRQMQEKPSVAAVFKDRNTYAPLNETIASASHICFLGPTLINVFSQWAGYLYFTKLNEHGARLQFILLNPNSSVLESTAEIMNEPPENFRKDIDRSVNRVESMLRDEGIQNGSLELRLMSANPNMSMVLIDPDKPNGKIFVEFIGYHSRLHTRPHIELTRKQDKEWYEYFLQQYRELWEHSTSHLSGGA